MKSFWTNRRVSTKSLKSQRRQSKPPARQRRSKKEPNESATSTKQGSSSIFITSGGVQHLLDFVDWLPSISHFSDIPIGPILHMPLFPVSGPVLPEQDTDMLPLFTPCQMLPSPAWNLTSKALNRAIETYITLRLPRNEYDLSFLFCTSYATMTICVSSWVVVRIYTPSSTR
jgi:hypothetical protein